MSGKRNADRRVRFTTDGLTGSQLEETNCSGNEDQAQLLQIKLMKLQEKQFPVLVYGCDLQQEDEKQLEIEKEEEPNVGNVGCLGDARVTSDKMDHLIGQQLQQNEEIVEKINKELKFGSVELKEELVSHKNKIIDSKKMFFDGYEKDVEAKEIFEKQEDISITINKKFNKLNTSISIDLRLSYAEPTNEPPKNTSENKTPSLLTVNKPQIKENLPSEEPDTNLELKSLPKVPEKTTTTTTKALEIKNLPPLQLDWRVPRPRESQSPSPTRSWSPLSTNKYVISPSITLETVTTPTGTTISVLQPPAVDVNVESAEFEGRRRSQSDDDDRNMDDRGSDDGHPRRTPSEIELRISRSLQKLHLPDWYKNSPLSRHGSRERVTKSSDKSTSKRPKWTEVRERSTSMSSLTLPLRRPSTPASSVHSGGRLTTTPSWRYSAGLTSPSSIASSPFNARREELGGNYFQYSTPFSSRCTSPFNSLGGFNYTRPYTGWRSSEKLARESAVVDEDDVKSYDQSYVNATSFYWSPEERLSRGPGYYAMKFGIHPGIFSRTAGVQRNIHDQLSDLMSDSYAQRRNDEVYFVEESEIVVNRSPISGQQTAELQVASLVNQIDKMINERQNGHLKDDETAPKIVSMTPKSNFLARENRRMVVTDCEPCDDDALSYKMAADEELALIKQVYPDSPSFEWSGQDHHPHYASDGEFQPIIYDLSTVDSKMAASLGLPVAPPSASGGRFDVRKRTVLPSPVALRPLTAVQRALVYSETHESSFSGEGDERDTASRTGDESDGSAKSFRNVINGMWRSNIRSSAFEQLQPTNETLQQRSGTTPNNQIDQLRFAKDPMPFKVGLERDEDVHGARNQSVTSQERYDFSQNFSLVQRLSSLESDPNIIELPIMNERVLGASPSLRKSLSLKKQTAEKSGSSHNGTLDTESDSDFGAQRRSITNHERGDAYKLKLTAGELFAASQNAVTGLYQDETVVNKANFITGSSEKNIPVVASSPVLEMTENDITVTSQASPSPIQTLTKVTKEDKHNKLTEADSTPKLQTNTVSKIESSVPDGSGKTPSVTSVDSATPFIISSSSPKQISTTRASEKENKTKSIKMGLTSNSLMSNTSTKAVVGQGQTPSVTSGNTVTVRQTPHVILLPSPPTTTTSETTQEEEMKCTETELTKKLPPNKHVTSTQGQTPSVTSGNTVTVGQTPHMILLPSPTTSETTEEDKKNTKTELTQKLSPNKQVTSPQGQTPSVTSGNTVTVGQTPHVILLPSPTTTTTSETTEDKKNTETELTKKLPTYKQVTSTQGQTLSVTSGDPGTVGKTSSVVMSPSTTSLLSTNDYLSAGSIHNQSVDSWATAQSFDHHASRDLSDDMSLGTIVHRVGYRPRGRADTTATSNDDMVSVFSGYTDDLSFSSVTMRRFDDQRKRDRRSVRSDLLDESVIVRCARDGCRRSSELRDARTNFKTCRNCYTYYCSHHCRKEAKERHRRQCLHGRSRHVCKQALQFAKDSEEVVKQLSKLAREGFVDKGRGYLRITLSNTKAGLKFIRHGVTRLEIPVKYLSSTQNDDDDLGQEMDTLLGQLSDVYDPQLKFILLVTMFVNREVMIDGLPHWERNVISKCAKIRLAKPETVVRRPRSRLNSSTGSLISRRSWRWSLA